MTTANEIAEKERRREQPDKDTGEDHRRRRVQAIADAAVTGAETSIAGFGTLKVKDTPAREGRSPSNRRLLRQP